jgi:signal transduction histidine kinase
MPPSAIDLKLRLALRVAIIAVLCCAAAAAYLLFEAGRSAQARADWIAEVVAKDLRLQRDQMQWIRGAPDRFPDLQRIAAALATPGLCVAYRAASGEIVQRLCSGTAPGEVGAPQLFARLYQALFDTRRESSHPLAVGDATQGEATAWIDPQTLVAQSWRETSHLLAILAGAFLGLCALTYVVLANALRPTHTIQAGLERLAAGDLSARLPPFDLAELSAIAKVFNHLAESLETTLAERNALTQRLILLQDEERRHLARELHDEFGQCLAAISAVAASAGQTAERECPALLPECRSIARTAAGMMDTLRGTLLRLRPPDVDELGLAASLESLVAGWNSRAGGSTRFSIELSGRFDALSQDFAASLYRIAQEAITNAAKHAQASRVTLRLCMQEPAGADQRAQIALTVHDDGKSGADPSAKPGMGLLGMRERIEALGGRLSFESSRQGGLVLCAQIPVPPGPTSRPAAGTTT